MLGMYLTANCRLLILPDTDWGYIVLHMDVGLKATSEDSRWTGIVSAWYLRSSLCI